MGRFIEQVRNSQVPQPTQHTFNLGRWEEAYNAISEHTEEDKRLFNDGIWVYNKLNAVRKKIAEVFFNNIAKSELIRYFCAYTNRAAHVLSPKKIPLINGDAYIAESLIQLETPENVLQPNATPDEVITGSIGQLNRDSDRFVNSSTRLGESLHDSLKSRSVEVKKYANGARKQRAFPFLTSPHLFFIVKYSTH